MWIVMAIGAWLLASVIFSAGMALGSEWTRRRMLEETLAQEPEALPCGLARQSTRALASA